MLSDNYQQDPSLVTVLGVGTVFKGVLSFENALTIKGDFEGEISSGGVLFIEEGAKVTASVKVRSLVIGGAVHGDIEASGRVEILPSGKVYGNIRAAKLKMADGVLFEGRCEMLQEPAIVDIFSDNPFLLKQNVKVF